MPITDSLGRLIPDATPGALETANPQEWFERYSLSDTGIVPVTSRTAANALLAARNTAAEQPGMGIARKPVVVWRTDELGGALEIHPNTGSAGEQWEHLGGRRHRATVSYYRESLSAGGEPLVMYAQSISNATPGWTISGNNLVVPASGMYAMAAVVNVSGAAGSLGRVFGQFSTTNGVLGARFATGTNENNYAGSLSPWPLSVNDQLRIQCYHESGGLRSYTATMHIVQLAV